MDGLFEHTDVYTQDLIDAREELKQIVQSADDEAKEYIKRSIDTMWRYKLSPIKFDDLYPETIPGQLTLF